ncbi:MAG: DeoR/GlpR transcriptional regulator [Selenomonadaceae bacterium]|nr:DeoR/GlpR transcriptional regulator [Selenomonadaceae bacterium]
MFLEERQQAILDLLKTDGKVKVKNLSEFFDVTEDCIRKDLGALERQGKLKRTYGGAVAERENLHMHEVAKHRDRDVDAKRKIAQAALKLIRERDMVFLDISTSNLAVAELLVKDEKDITVVTNMIDILVLLARKPNVKLVFVGGTLNKSHDGFWGNLSFDLISKLKPDIAFVGAVGVDVKENSVSTYDIEDGANKAAIIRHSKKAYVVAEARKLNSDGNYNYTTLDTLSGLITDQKPSKDICDAAEKYGVQIILP